MMIEVRQVGLQVVERCHVVGERLAMTSGVGKNDSDPVVLTTMFVGEIAH